MNIVDILKYKLPQIPLYDVVIGATVYFKGYSNDKIFCSYSNKIIEYNNEGKMYSNKDAIQALTPSKEMRDWSKFAWKKGDVLVSNDNTTEVIFNGWKDDTYTLFRGAYALITHNDGKIEFGSDSLIFETCNYKGIEVEDAAQSYINYIERRLGGKLNLETLEIEKPEFKDGDILVTDAVPSLLYSKCIFILKGGLSTNDSNAYSYIFYNVQNNKIHFNILDGDVRRRSNIRLATYSEKKQLFKALANEGKAWDAEKKQIVALKSLWTPKPFDKVLVRNDKEDQWSANIFSYQVRDNMYYCLGECYWRYCIPYEGNESLLGTTKDVKATGEWKG